MLYYTRKGAIPFLNTYSKRPRPLVWLLLTLSLLSACRSPEIIRHEVKLAVDNPIAVDIPSNWQTSQYERNNSFSLWRESGVLRKESARIYVQALTSLPAPTSSEEILTTSLNYRVRNLAERNGASIVQEPVSFESGVYDIATAIFQYLEETSTLERLIGPGPAGKRQTVEMRTITCTGEWGGFATVHFSPGDNQEINTEARAIIDSIQLLDCE